MECLGSTSPHQRNQGRTHISPILMPIINRNIDGHWTGHGLLLFSRFIDIQRIHGYNLNTSVWHFGPIQNTLPWGNLLWFPKSVVNQSKGKHSFSFWKKMNRNKWSTQTFDFQWGVWHMVFQRTGTAFSPSPFWRSPSPLQIVQLIFHTMNGEVMTYWPVGWISPGFGYLDTFSLCVTNNFSTAHISIVCFHNEGVDRPVQVAEDLGHDHADDDQEEHHAVARHPLKRPSPSWSRWC